MRHLPRGTQGRISRYRLGIRGRLTSARVLCPSAPTTAGIPAGAPGTTGVQTASGILLRNVTLTALAGTPVLIPRLSRRLAASLDRLGFHSIPGVHFLDLGREGVLSWLRRATGSQPVKDWHPARLAGLMRQALRALSTRRFPPAVLALAPPATHAVFWLEASLRAGLAELGRTDPTVARAVVAVYVQRTSTCREAARAWGMPESTLYRHMAAALVRVGEGILAANTHRESR